MRVGKRPENITVQVKQNGQVVEEAKVIEETEWKHTFELPKYDELGDEIKYTVDEKETVKYYEKKIEGETVINTCVYNPETSDKNIVIYMVIFLVAVIGIFVGILFVKKSKKKV